MKKIVALLMSLVMLIALTLGSGCTPLTEQIGTVAYNGALVTASSLNVYNNYDGINNIILNHIKDFSVEDQVTVQTISVKFAGFKSDFDRLTDKAENIYKVTMNIDQYMIYYTEMRSDYITVKAIVAKNIDKFTELEKRSLAAFDKDIMLLNNQVEIVKATIQSKADEYQVDITGIVEKTVGLAKAFATIATMM